MTDSVELFDLAAVREMADGCGWTLAEFVDLYLSNTHQEMGRLRTAGQAERKRLAHGLAGSSATAGVVGMTKILRSIEHADESADIPGLIRAADERLEAVEAALRKISAA